MNEVALAIAKMEHTFCYTHFSHTYTHSLSPSLCLHLFTPWVAYSMLHFKTMRCVYSFIFCYEVLCDYKMSTYADCEQPTYFNNVWSLTPFVNKQKTLLYACRTNGRKEIANKELVQRRGTGISRRRCIREDGSVNIAEIIKEKDNIHTRISVVIPAHLKIEMCLTAQ